jgi:aminoglycoside phosphotransferase (APT) family kinase protein
MTPHPQDPVLDFEQVIRLARKHQPSAHVVTAVDESGGEARTYAIDDGLIFKTQRPHRVRPRTSLQKEALHLNLLASHLPELLVPRVLAYGRDDGVEYTLMTRIPGTAVLRTSIAGDERRLVLSELGRVLRHVHRLPVASLRDSGLFPGDQGPDDTRARIETELRRAVEAIAGERDAWTLSLTPGDLARQVLELLDTITAQPVGLHSNPGPEHVFVDGLSHLSGLIDFGDAYISHPAFDLRRWTAEEDRQALLGGYAADEPLDEGFQVCWRAIAVAGLMNDVVFRPPRRAQSLEALGSIAAQL